MHLDIDIPMVLADDQKITRLGLKITLESIPGVRIVGEASNGQEAVALVEKLRPAIVFMDVNMPQLDGVQATEIIKSRVPETRVIVFTADGDEDTFLAALCAGADAYCLKDSNEQQLSGAINAVLQGAKWLDSNLANSLLQSKKASPSQSGKSSGFTERQKQILQLIDRGQDIEEIAGTLSLGVTQIKLELNDILERLQPASEDRASKSAMLQLKAMLEANHATVPSSSSGESLVGSMLSGKYLVEELLGSGGMSIVYRAKHVLMDKPVAVKVLLPHLLSDSALVERFRCEAKAVGKISHPNIVPVHDFGISEMHNQPYLVMEYVSGETMEDLLQRSEGNLPIPYCIRIFCQMCDALSVLDEHGVVHRDLKPSNIMLSETHGYTVVKILDFGIAKVLTTESDHRITKTGEIFGSPTYMSPEQVLALPLDTRSDLYAIGCIMYEVLTGRPPFSSESTYNVMWQHVNEPPSRLPFLKRGNAVPEILQSVTFKLLSKNPHDRFQTVGALKAELMRILDESLLVR